MRRRLRRSRARGWRASDRKAKLARLLARKPVGIVFNEHTDEDGATMFRHACKLGLEGIVSKRLGAPYRSGPSRDWLKVKNPNSLGRFRERREKGIRDGKSDGKTETKEDGEVQSQRIKEIAQLLRSDETGRVFERALKKCHLQAVLILQEFLQDRSEEGRISKIVGVCLP